MESQEREQGFARSFWSLQSLSHYGRNLEGKHYKSREWRRVHVIFSAEVFGCYREHMRASSIQYQEWE
jgi:SRSO17 transposase